MAKLLKQSLKMLVFPYYLSNTRKRYKFTVDCSETQAQVFWNTHNTFLLNFFTIKRAMDFLIPSTTPLGDLGQKRLRFCCALAAHSTSLCQANGTRACSPLLCPPPTPSSYVQSQRMPQQIYLWRHFVSLILRIHRNICVIHHSLLQETFFILHLKQGKKSDRL